MAEKRTALVPVDHDPFAVTLGELAGLPARQLETPPELHRPQRSENVGGGPKSKAYADKTVLVYDNGLFVELAATLAKDFGTVLYYAPWEEPYPTTRRLLIGAGIPGVTRVDSFWPYVDDVDLFVFPDVNFGTLQAHLVKLGKRVWGARLGESLELDRDASKKLMKRIGIDVGPYKAIRGMSALREHLKENEGQFVKISRARGDMESFHAERYDLVEPVLDDLEHRFGARKELIKFIAEDGIPDAVELAYDGWTIDGNFAKAGTRGIEVKDKGFVMRSGPYADIAEPLRDINAKLADTFAAFQYRGFISVEARITEDHRAFVIDPCCRLPSPPSQLYWIMITNWADILWEGADGVIVEPELAAPWGAELIMTSTWAGEGHWQPISFPKALRDQIRICNLTMIDGKYFSAQDYPEIGGVVALGDTMEAAIKGVKEAADQIEGYGIETHTGALDDAQSQIEKLEEFGLKL